MFTIELDGGGVVAIADDDAVRFIKRLVAENAKLEQQSERRRQLLESSDARVNRLSEQVAELEARLAEAESRLAAVSGEWDHMRDVGGRLLAENVNLKKAKEQAEARAEALPAALERIAIAEPAFSDFGQGVAALTHEVRLLKSLISDIKSIAQAALHPERPAAAESESNNA